MVDSSTPLACHLNVQAVNSLIDCWAHLMPTIREGGKVISTRSSYISKTLPSFISVVKIQNIPAQYDAVPYVSGKFYHYNSAGQCR